MVSRVWGLEGLGFFSSSAVAFCGFRVWGSGGLGFGI